MIDVLLKAAGITGEDVKGMTGELKGAREDICDIKMTGYDGLEMLKKILVELQELNAHLALLTGRDRQ